jgi:hypothetical protein
VIATNFLGEASEAAVHTISALSPLPLVLQIQVPLPPFFTTQVSNNFPFATFMGVVPSYPLFQDPWVVPAWPPEGVGVALQPEHMRGRRAFPR